METPFIETNCTVEHNGQKFTAGGAAVTDKECIAYLAKANVLTDWHGNPIGTYRIASVWKTPRSYVSDVMCAVHATVNGKLYKGRSAGIGMSFRGKLSERAK